MPARCTRTFAALTAAALLAACGGPDEARPGTTTVPRPVTTSTATPTTRTVPPTTRTVPPASTVTTATPPVATTAVRPTTVPAAPTSTSRASPTTDPAVTGSTRPTGTPFPRSPAAFLAEHPDATRVRAAALDLASGGRWSWGTTDLPLPTASVVKVQVMGAVYLRLQDQGATTTPETLRPLLRSMITVSDNAATNRLVDWLGGLDDLQRLGSRLGLQETDNTPPPGFTDPNPWGVTLTTPEDQLRLLETVLLGRGVLGAAWVERARTLMADVIPAQRYSIEAAVPPGWRLYNKNGWRPTEPGNWNHPVSRNRMGTIGLVEDPATGDGFLLAILGDSWTSKPSGTDGMADLARGVGAALAGAPR